MYEYIPETTLMEQEARESFSKMEVKSVDELIIRIGKIFSEVCGEYGATEFNEYVIPAVLKIYGDNYRKAGIRLLEVIDEGAEQNPKNIGNYFKNAVSASELEYAEKNKDAIISELITTINTLILEAREEYGEQYKGVIAVIILGVLQEKIFP